MLWHERDISHSSAERVIFPDAFILVDYMLGLMTEIQALDTPEFQEAGDNISKHAKDECGVDLQA